ncbi:hypothetical protein SAMN04488128_10183 [Chitinophaga eiseniae]|uniref:Uncharacterized protein n=1 Tax=Chitinophaga eiseniae TaxID=634771 RepID=A0A1T4KE89_9BACT|nr:hypothetical protein [Chitinophaga eiseniae]SJZ40742.1 hypothetical protein SAMN04488128_10183 [Chitinophaga eiseniae]
MLKNILYGCALTCVLLLLWQGLQAQQLLLSDTVAAATKSALLEIRAKTQGLLLPRIQDTAVAPLSSSPNGMLIYYIPASSVMVRRNGGWSRLADSIAVTGSSWKLTGNADTDSLTKFVGTTDATGLVFRTNNTQRVIISSTGNVGVGTATPSATLHVNSGVANTSGVLLQNLTSASPVTANAAGIGVDATGKVVRTATAPLFYNKSSSSPLNNTMKIWADTLYNAGGGSVTANISNAGFTNILSIQATGLGGTGSGVSDGPIPVVTSFTTTAVNMVIVRGNAGLTILNGMAQDTDKSHKVFLTVIGY